MDFQNKNTLTQVSGSDLLKRLIEKAPLESMNVKSNVEFPRQLLANEPSYFAEIDLDLLEEGQKFFEHNFFALMFTKVMALFLGYSGKFVSSVLLRAGHPKDPNFSRTRYIRTASHFMDWYQLDFRMDAAGGVKNILKVRDLHRKILKNLRQSQLSIAHSSVFSEDQHKVGEEVLLLDAIEADLAYLDTSGAPHHLFTYEPTVPMSQFDMGVTQISFVFLVRLFPAQFAIVDTGRGMEGFMYFWSMVGEFLGLKPCFNMVAEAHALGVVGERDFYQKACADILLASLKASDALTLRMQQSLLSGFSGVLPPSISHRVLLYFGLSVIAPPGFDGVHLRKIMSWTEYLMVQIIVLVMSLIRHSSLARLAANFVARKLICQQVAVQKMDSEDSQE